MGTCDVRVVMLHPVRVPPASGSLPPRMFPREIPSAALHDAVTSNLRQAAPAPAQFLASLSLAFSGRNMPPASRAAVPAFPRFRSAPPPPASPPPPPQRVPHRAFRHRVHTSHHGSTPPKNPHFNAARTRIEDIVFFIGVNPSRYRLQSHRLKWNLFDVRPLFHLTRRLFRRRRVGLTPKVRQF